MKRLLSNHKLFILIFITIIHGLINNRGNNMVYAGKKFVSHLISVYKYIRVINRSVEVQLFIIGFYNNKWIDEELIIVFQLTLKIHLLDINNTSFFFFFLLKFWKYK